MVVLQNSRQRPKKPLLRFTATLTVYTRSVANDLDNAVARAKPVFDLLKRQGWIVDDGPAHLVVLKVMSRTDSKRPRLELELTPC